MFIKYYNIGEGNFKNTQDSYTTNAGSSTILCLKDMFQPVCFIGILLKGYLGDGGRLSLKTDNCYTDVFKDTSGGMNAAGARGSTAMF